MGRLTNLKGIILASQGVIDLLLAILIALSLLYFMWGLARMVFRVAGDEGAIEEGKRIMLWGIIALFVMVSIWGIVNFLANSFGFGPRNPASYQNNNFIPPGGVPIFE